MHSKKDKKPTLIWLQGVTCNGNTHSFLNLPYIESLLDRFDILYHPILSSTIDIEQIASCRYECDILIFEGSYDPIMKRGGRAISTIVDHYTRRAKYIIAVGSCASFGGIFKASAPQRVRGLVFDGYSSYESVVEYSHRVINLSGCPIHPEWLGYTLSMIAYGREIEVDELHRPIELYSNLAHHGCSRNEYFEWKVDSKQFGKKEGCLYYELGCRAPMTHASCNKTLWNEVSSKTRVGTPCFGCTEPDFPREDIFVTKKNMSIPKDVPLGVPKRNYLTLSGIAKSFHIKRLEGRLIDYKKDHRSDRG